MVELFANSGDPDQLLCSAASELGLHCLPIKHLGVSSHQCVKEAFGDNSGIIFCALHKNMFCPEVQAFYRETFEKMRQTY